jgi:hypothetical protein
MFAVALHAKSTMPVSRQRKLFARLGRLALEFARADLQRSSFLRSIRPFARCGADVTLAPRGSPPGGLVLFSEKPPRSLRTEMSENSKLFYEFGSFRLDENVSQRSRSTKSHERTRTNTNKNRSFSCDFVLLRVVSWIVIALRAPYYRVGRRAANTESGCVTAPKFV